MRSFSISNSDTLFDYWNKRESGTEKESLIWISESKKLLYLKSCKCASTSIAQTLIKNIPDMKNLRAYRKAPDFSKYYKVTFVRNPWDRMVSLYHNYYDTNKLKRKFEVPEMTFDEFMHSDVIFKYQTVTLHAMPIMELTVFNGKQQMDFIGKVENLNQDFAKLRRFTTAKLPKSNATKKRKHYSKYYTDETKQMIAEWYHKDIEEFGYTFELEK